MWIGEDERAPAGRRQQGSVHRTRSWRDDNADADAFRAVAEDDPEAAEEAGRRLPVERPLPASQVEPTGSARRCPSGPS